MGKLLGDARNMQKAKGYADLTDPSTVPSWARKEVGMIRQLINEEWIAKDKLISSAEVWRLCQPLIARGEEAADEKTRI